MGVWLVASALAQENSRSLPFFKLTREERVITVQQTATDAEGGLFVNNGQGCGEEGTYFSTVYAPAPKVVEVTVNDTLITANIVLREQPSGNQDEATLNMVGGKLEFDFDTFCPADIQPNDTPSVTIYQDRTTIDGSRFLYDNSTGLGTLEGPVTLERIAKEDSPALTATSESLEFNVDEDVTTLIGNVQVVSEDRVSEAESLVYNEEAGIAILYGDPARSRMGEDVVEGSIIKYDLDSNDVVVTENVSATFEYQPEDEP